VTLVRGYEQDKVTKRAQSGDLDVKWRLIMKWVLDSHDMKNCAVKK
jgi:hypothetical protein